MAFASLPLFDQGMVGCSGCTCTNCKVAKFAFAGVTIKIDILVCKRKLHDLDGLFHPCCFEKREQIIYRSSFGVNMQVYAEVGNYYILKCNFTAIALQVST